MRIITNYGLWGPRVLQEALEIAIKYRNGFFRVRDGFIGVQHLYFFGFPFSVVQAVRPNITGREK